PMLPTPTSDQHASLHVTSRRVQLSIRTGGKTVFLRSHLLSGVEMVCDRVAMLNKGKVVKLGKTSEWLQAGQETEIVARGITATCFPAAVETDGVVRFTVPVAQQKFALERVWERGGEVVSVNPVRRSLEQIFLEVTGQQPEKSALGVGG